MVRAKSKNITVINRSALKSLRMIMEEEFPEVIQSFLDSSLSQHTDLHAAIAMKDYESLKLISSQFKDCCIHIGAEILADKIVEMEGFCRCGDYQSLDEVFDRIDQLYGICRIELQAELNKDLKRAV